MERPKKPPAVERRVSEITEDDLLVRVIGTIKDIDGNSFTLEDETGSIKINADDNVDAGSKVRVFGKPMKEENILILTSELVQDIRELNDNIYKKIKSKGL